MTIRQALFGFFERASARSTQISDSPPYPRKMIMKKLTMCLSLCSVFMLHGCFDSADNTTKDNTGGSKSSVQMQEGKAKDSQ